jgi:hypothetical protein
VNPNPPQPSSGRSANRQEVALDEAFDCSGGVLTVSVTSSGSGVEGLSVRLVGSASADTQTSDGQGKARFTITADDTYRLYSSQTDNYMSATSDPFTLTLCPVQNVTQNVTPPENQTQPQGNGTTGGQGGTGGTNVSGPQNVTTPQNVTQPANNVTQGDANTALTNAQAAITAAKNAGKDTSKAQAMLQAAQNAFNAGDYATAMALSQQAESLASAAAPAKVAPATPSVQKNAPQAGGSILWAIVLVVVLVGILGGAYWFLKGPKRRK